MFSSCVSIDESRSPVACTTALRPTSRVRSCVTLTVSCAWNGYGMRHWRPASTVWLYRPKDVTTACWPSCTMKKPLPSQISATTPAIRLDADAGALHVGLEVAAAAAVAAVRTRPARTALPAAEQAAELAVEVAPEFVEVGRSVVATGQ